MISFRHLTKNYGGFNAVSDLDFSVEPGEVFGLVGPNGAGKTTIIRMMMGILVPSSGGITIAGFDCQRDRIAVKRQVGYLPDEPIFYAYLRGREVLEFIADMHGLSRGIVRRRTNTLMNEFALGDAGEEYASNYSVGMRKKLALACALIHDPAVIILDEPSNGLDPRTAHEIHELLHRQATLGRTIFLTTYRLELAERLCGRVGIIDRGRLLAVGAPAELKQGFSSNGALEQELLKRTEACEANAGCT